MNKTSISWTDFSSNPLYVVDKETGQRGWFCEKVSPGCAHCYASALNVRRGTGHAYLSENRDKVEWRLNEREMEAILKRRKPTRIFMCDMLDLFHDDVPDAFIDRVFATMALAREHTFQLLTKRPERMRMYLNDIERPAKIAKAWGPLEDKLTNEEWLVAGAWAVTGTMPWPLPNVWLGVSVENQYWADRRIPVLLDTPAAVRFLSCEPLLGALDLTPWLTPLPEMESETCQRCNETGEEVICCDDLCANSDECIHGDGYAPCSECGGVGQIIQNARPAIDWVICGGESGAMSTRGGPERALVERCGDERHEERWHATGDVAYRCDLCQSTGWRPKPQALEWVRSLVVQCQQAGVPLLMKQWGGPKPASGGRLVDGKLYHEFPKANADGA